LPRRGLGRHRFDPGKQGGIELAADRPAAVPEIEARQITHGILPRGGKRGEGADVAPVTALLMVLHAGDAVLGEIVGVHALRAAEPRQDVAPEVGLAGAARLVQRPLQHVGIEQVISHRSIGARRIGGQRRGLLRLLAELGDPAFGRGREDAEARSLLERHGHRGDGDVGAALAVEGGHLANVHPVHMVGGEYRHEVGRVRLEQVQALVDGVGGALELAAAGIGARQQHLEGAFAAGEPRRPRRRDVLDQRLGLVLREHVDR